MTREYTEGQVEGAALICQIAASNYDGNITEAQADAAAAIGADAAALDLARDAYIATPWVDDLNAKDALELAEAESWIRSGWRSPGDEDVLFPRKAVRS